MRFSEAPSHWDDEKLIVRGGGNGRVCIAPLAISRLCHSDFSWVVGQGDVTEYMAKMTSYTSKRTDKLAEWIEDAPSGYHAALTYLRASDPSEAKMIMMLNQCSVMRFSCPRKEVLLPTPCEIDHPQFADVQKYMRCSDRSDVTCLDWMRLYNTSVSPPRKYQRLKGSMVALVVRHPSRMKDSYYGQWLVGNVPFRKSCELTNSSESVAFGRRKYFSLCCARRPECWRNLDWIESELKLDGTKFLDRLTQLNMYKSWIRMIDLVQLHGWIDETTLERGSHVELQDDSFLNTVISEAAVRRECRDEDKECTPSAMYLVHGPPGTGKSVRLNGLVEECIRHGDRVILVTPTGALADVYRQKWRDHALVQVDTFDGGFEYGGDVIHAAWKLHAFAVWIVDELFFLSPNHVRHMRYVHQLCEHRSLLVTAGDPGQFASPLGRLTPTSPELNDARCYRLTQCFRSEDESLTAAIMHVRTRWATLDIISKITHDRVLSTDIDIAVATYFRLRPDGVLLAVERTTVRNMNDAAIKYYFEHVHYLVRIGIDWYGEVAKLEIYEGMRMMVTRNVDKHNGVVNGAFGNVLFAASRLVVLRLYSGALCEIYPVTYEQDDGRFYQAFPLVPAYATTIAKVQGRTLSSVCIYPDICVPAAGYVAISRVRRLTDLYWIGAPTRSFFKPN